MTESALHKAVAEYLAVALRPPVFWTTFPAGGGGKARGGKLKAMGLKAGVPDILVLSPYGDDGTFLLGIELKADRGALSTVQKETHRALAATGMLCRVARSVEHVRDILRANGIPLYARVGASYPSKGAAPARELQDPDIRGCSVTTEGAR